MYRCHIIGSITDEYFYDYIGDQTHYEDDLDLSYTNITSLSNLKSVGGVLDLTKSKITSLSELKHAGGLHLVRSGIQNLGKLESVHTHLNLDRTEITSLGNLKSVGGNLGLNHTNITDLGKLEVVGGIILCTRDSPTHELLMNSKFKDQLWVE